MDLATKKKLLAAATTKLKKAYGDNVILDPEAKTSYKVISSGSMLFDQATGVGGIVLGKVYEIYGAEAVGKSTWCFSACAQAQKAYPDKMILYIDIEQACITGDSLVYLPDLNTNKKIENLVGQEPFNVMSITKDKNLINRQAIAVSKGYRPVYKLLGSKGFSIKATEDHKILTKEGFKELKDISKDDIIYTPKYTTNYIEKESFSISLEEQAKYRLLGLWIGDGTVKQPTISCVDNLIEQDLQEMAKLFNCRLRRDFYSLWFTSLEEDRSLNVEPELLKELFINQNKTLSECAYYFNSCSATIKKLLFKYKLVDENYDFRFHSMSKRIQRSSSYETSDLILTPFKNAVTSFLSQFECFKEYSKERFIPENLTRDQLRQVLAGIYLADGCTVNSDNQKRTLAFYATSSYNLAIDLQTSLLSFGITSRISVNLKKKEDNTYYDPCYNVTFTGVDNFKNFLKYIPIYGYKKERMEKAVEEVLSVDKNTIDNDLIELKVKSVEYVGIEKVYDISLLDPSLDDYEKNFIANNLVIHNCNLPYLQSFGVDISPDKFIFCQPSSAEEALTIMEEYVNTSLFSLAIYDSVGASLTLDQLEKGIDQATMGSLAKKMSVGLNKLKNSANTTETALVFVNQVYDKIGTFSAYGTPTETKGGKALKYTASARIQLAKRDLIASEDNKEIISGQVLSFKFVKNKLGQPYQKGETILYFGKGFDEFSEVTDLAIKFDYIHRGGAWFSFKTKDGTDMKLQGKASVISYLTNTLEDFQYYKDLVINHLKEGKIIEIDPSIADEDEE